MLRRQGLTSVGDKNVADSMSSHTLSLVLTACQIIVIRYIEIDVPLQPNDSYFRETGASRMGTNTLFAFDPSACLRLCYKMTCMDLATWDGRTVS